MTTDREPRCEFCGEGPECAVCGRGAATFAGPWPGGSTDPISVARQIRAELDRSGLNQGEFFSRVAELIFGHTDVTREIRKILTT